jgi:hypothetical protein
VRESEPFGEAQPLDTSKRQSRTDKDRLLVNIESHFQSHPMSEASEYEGLTPSLIAC